MDCYHHVNYKRILSYKAVSIMAQTVRNAMFRSSFCENSLKSEVQRLNLVLINFIFHDFEMNCMSYNKLIMSFEIYLSNTLDVPVTSCHPIIKSSPDLSYLGPLHNFCIQICIFPIHCSAPRNNARMFLLCKNILTVTIVLCNFF